LICGPAACWCRHMVACQTPARNRPKKGRHPSIQTRRRDAVADRRAIDDTNTVARYSRIIQQYRCGSVCLSVTLQQRCKNIPAAGATKRIEDCIQKTSFFSVGVIFVFKVFLCAVETSLSGTGGDILVAVYDQASQSTSRLFRKLNSYDSTVVLLLSLNSKIRW
jgi:hypothetical protein